MTRNQRFRQQFNWAGLYYTGLKRGKDYKLNNKVITINILMYNIFKKENYHTIATIRDNENKEKITDRLEIHFIELPKFLKSKENGNRKLRQWLEFICNKRKGEIEMAVKENEKIAKASQEWEYLRGDEAVKRMAFLREKWERDWNSGMHSAEEEGIEKGLKQGKEEVAIKMLKKGISETTIEEVTSLTLEEIERIKENLKNEVECELK